MSAVFSQNLRRVDFQDFLRFVAVRSCTADSSLLQPTGGVNTTLHTSIFTVNYMHTHGSSFGSALTHPISCFM